MAKKDMAANISNLKFGMVTRHMVVREKGHGKKQRLKPVMLTDSKKKAKRCVRAMQDSNNYRNHYIITVETTGWK